MRDHVRERVHRVGDGSARRGYPDDQRGDAWEPSPTVGDSATEKQSDDEPWEHPILLADAPAVDPFPEAVLPTPLATFVREAASALACPSDYIGVPLLAICWCGYWSQPGAYEIKPGWQERPCLYAAIVAPPGSAKSPALKLVASPIYAEQARLRTIHDRQKTAHEENEAKSAKPKLSTIYVPDITIEALAGVLLANPRGVALIRDELTAWVTAMDQYRAKGRGSDRQFYLATWAGEPVFVHRKTQEDGPVFVPHPFMTVIRCVPPDLLSRLRGERQVSDGFFDRILFSYPEPAPVIGETWLCVSDEVRRDLGEDSQEAVGAEAGK